MTEIMYKSIESIVGEDIIEYAQRLIDSRDKNIDSNIKGKFNDIPLIIDNESTKESIVEQFREKLDEEHINYVNSDKYINKQIERIYEIHRLNNEAYCLMKAFDNLDFGNYEDVLYWLRDIQTYSDHTGVEIPKRKIVNTLHRYGYIANENVVGEENFNEDDEVYYARYIIGQCLNFLEKEPHAIHPIIHSFIQKWKNKFRNTEIQI